MYTLETHVCYTCCTTTLSGEVTTREWLAAASKPGSVLKVKNGCQRPSVTLWAELAKDSDTKLQDVGETAGNYGNKVHRMH